MDALHHAEPLSSQNPHPSAINGNHHTANGDHHITIYHNHNDYPSSHMLPEIFQDFLLQQDENMDLGYVLSSQTPELQYPELRHLHEQPLMGMPSGSQFLPNPHIPPLPYDPNYGMRYPIGGDGGYV